MNKQEVIKYLEKKRETALDNFEYYRDKENEKYETMNRARVDSYTIAIQAVEQIDEPQAEKVEVTEKQAELLRAFKGESLYELLANCLREDEELMAKAHLYSYTVKPKRWVVKLSNNYYFSSWVPLYSLEADGTAYKFYDDVFVFDDRTKAEAVAVLVEGTVEEVAE